MDFTILEKSEIEAKADERKTKSIITNTLTIDKEKQFKVTTLITIIKVKFKNTDCKSYF